jgi:hypothetical protein
MHVGWRCLSDDDSCARFTPVGDAQSRLQEEDVLIPIPDVDLDQILQRSNGQQRSHEKRHRERNLGAYQHASEANRARPGKELGARQSGRSFGAPNGQCFSSRASSAALIACNSTTAGSGFMRI